VSRLLKLHGVWDTSLVERLYGGQNEMTVAKRLVQKYASRAAEWQEGRIDLAKIQAWIEESIRRAKDLTYAQIPGYACGADMKQTRITLSEEYLQHAEPVVEEQLAKAGYRPRRDAESDLGRLRRRLKMRSTMRVVITVALIWSLTLLAGEASAQCNQPAQTIKETTVYNRAPTFSTGSGWRLGSQIEKLPAGASVTICERIEVGLFFDRKQWCRVQYDGNKTGWVYMGDVVTTSSYILPPTIVHASYLLTASAVADEMDANGSSVLPSRTTFHLYVLSFLAVMLGMFGKVAYDELDTGREISVRDCFNARKCLKAMIIAPVTYLGFLYVGDFSTPGELRTIVIAMCLAFQNGFFWQTTLPTKVQQGPPVVNEQR
jgi:hypothetical protein